MKYMILVCAVVSGCAARVEQGDEFSTLRAHAKSVCEVMADPNSHVGQRIIVHGIYFAEPHGRVLYDEKCRGSGLRVKYSLQADGDPRAEAMVERFRKRHPTVRIPVIYSAVLKSRVIMSGCTKPNCYEYSFEEAVLLGAFPHSVIPRAR